MSDEQRIATLRDDLSGRGAGGSRAAEGASMKRGLTERWRRRRFSGPPPRVYGIDLHLEPASAQRLQEILSGLLGGTLARREIEALWSELPPPDQEMLAPLRGEIDGYWLRQEAFQDLALRL